MFSFSSFQPPSGGAEEQANLTGGIGDDPFSVGSDLNKPVKPATNLSTIQQQPFTFVHTEKKAETIGSTTTESEGDTLNTNDDGEEEVSQSDFEKRRERALQLLDSL